MAAGDENRALKFSFIGNGDENGGWIFLTPVTCHLLLVEGVVLGHR